MKKVKVAIIGAGTSGLTARREVARYTDSYVVIDDGPLGTTCARVGCMPSKVLIQAANDFYRRQALASQGILGGEALRVDHGQVMDHVRQLRDRFVSSVLNPMEGWQEHFIAGKAHFIDSNHLQVGEQVIEAEKIILALGSRPIIPPAWMPYREYLLTTDEFFELSQLPHSIAVLGLGVIGLELGQALSRLGVKTTGITVQKTFGGLTDPELQDYVESQLTKEFPVHIAPAEVVGVTNDGLLEVQAGHEVVAVEKALLSLGRRSNLDRVNFSALDIPVNERGMPEIDPNTMQVKGAGHIFIPGDVNGSRPILHEAADEGVIAGHNAVAEVECFKRRVPLGITFSDPNIAVIGESFANLQAQDKSFVTGQVSFEGQGRSIVKLKEQGRLHIYADAASGLILGAELQAPDGEHLAHILSWAISLKLTVKEALKLPFYHPVVEEGLRTALRDAASQIGTDEKELFRCQDPPIR